MIHPSYYELMEKINKDNAGEDAPIITSRYSIVLATSKRARQLISGAEPKIISSNPKQLSVAVEEFYRGLVHIVSEDSAEEKPEAENEDTVAVNDQDEHSEEI